MPPFSRGHLLLFRSSPIHLRLALRHISSTFRCLDGINFHNARAAKSKKPTYKSSPIPGRAHPQASRKGELRTQKPLTPEALEETLGSKRPSLLGRLRDRVPYRLRKYIANVLIFGPIVAIVWLHFPIQIMSTNGGSMSPFLNPGHQHGRGEEPEKMDKLLVRRLRSGFLRRDNVVDRGDVIVFKSPVHYNGSKGRVAVKRVVGVPGDRVWPLAGWEGEDDGVVVPFNHFWVEGDVEDRARSVDSNWYGPISQALVVGRVEWVLKPWWRPRKMVATEQTWPAKEKRRVEEGVVQEAMMSPDEVAHRTSWVDGTAERELEIWRTDKDRLVEMAKGAESRLKLQKFYEQAKKEVVRADVKSERVAREMMNELQDAFKAAGISGGSTPSTREENNSQATRW